jgi:hypothetical protein
MSSGAPLILYNISSNPTILGYLSRSLAKVGHFWKIPVNTGNVSFGIIDKVTITFAGIENITV